MLDLSALWNEEATEEEVIDCYQELVNTGIAWQLEGYVGRTAMDLIKEGRIMLGEVATKDYWGNRVPSRYDVEPGTKGSREYMEAHIAD